MSELRYVPDLGPVHIMLDGDAALPPKKGAQPPMLDPCLLWSNVWMDQDATWYRGRLDGDPAAPPPLKRGTALTFRPMFIVAKRLDGSACQFGTKVGLSLDHIVLHVVPALPKRDTVPNFRPMSIVAKRSPVSASAEHLSRILCVLDIFSCYILGGFVNRTAQHMINFLYYGSAL